jgi:undecaprenyl-diphosphatase
MQELIKDSILAIVQGLTEFLPVSSDGHLAILQNYFGDVDVSFDVFLHLATLLAVFVYFYKDIIEIIKAVFTLDTKSENFKIATYIIIASIPAAIFGFWLNDKINSIFSNLIFAALGFVVTGMFLFTASFADKMNSKKLSYSNTFMMGIAQALAILPGLSRSGSTVSTGMLLGISKEKAIRFSFLLSIPAIIGASLLKIPELAISSGLILPFILAFLTGLAAIHIFLKKIKVENLRIFAYYCWILAIIILSIKLF